MIKQLTIGCIEGVLRQRSSAFLTGSNNCSQIFIRHKYKDITVPKPGKGNYFRRVVHYPDKYTIKPVPTTNLAGRDPLTGTKKFQTLYQLFTYVR